MADRNSKELPESLIRDMIGSIRHFMCHWHRNDNAADYCCEYCGEIAKSNIDWTINHRPDCDGQRFLNELESYLDPSIKD